MKTQSNNKIKRIETVSVLVVIIASMLAVGVIDPTKNAYAVACTGTYGTHCYATHIFDPYFSVNGIQSTEKVLYTTGTNGWVENSNWVMLYDGNFLEVGWHQNTVSGGGNPYFLWAKNGITQTTWGSPSDNTYYTFTAEDLALDNVWKMSAGGQEYTGTMTTPYSNEIQVGYEFTYTSEINLRTNDYANMEYGTPTTGWVLWNSGDGTHGRYLQPGAGYFVHGCGTTWDTDPVSFYHSQHGQGTEPSSCT